MSGFGYNILGFGGGGPPPPEVDDGFNRVNFLSHFDGANNGVNNEFDDGSASNHSVTRNGDAQQGSFGPFARPDGEWGVDFKNTSALALPQDNADFNFGTANFTIECFMLYKGNPSSDDSYIISFGGGSGNAGHFGLNIYNGDWRSGAFNDNLSAGTAPTDRAWHHVAQVYESNVFKLYVDGTLVSSVGSDGPFEASTAIISGYWDNSDANCFNGLISNLRIVKGTAVYTSNFTPPTGPLTAISGTVLLACQSNHFVDNSASGHTLTPVVSPSVTAFGAILTDAAYDPAVNGASCSLDGTGDALTGPTSNDFGFGDNSFTVEVWIYPTVIDDYNVPIGTSGSSGDGRWYLSYGATSIYWGSYGNGSNGDLTVDHDMTPNAWYHLAYVRNKSDDKGRLYVNGVQKGVQDDARTYANPSQVLKIGKDHTANNNMKGYISDARVVNGTAVYTSAFTPPAAPLTAITNTKLLLNMANGQAIDSAAQNNLTLIGGTKISTGQAKFGDTSIYFDGAGDYATLTNSASNNLGDGDWTIEGWLYLTANAGTGNDEFAVASKFGGGSTRSWLARIANGNKLTFWYINSSGTQVELTADTRVLSLNTWYHVAWVKNSNLKVYINGVGATLASSDFQIRDGTDLIQLSGRASGDNMYEGYIDDFRISSMARYTNNFTAPTKPFADKGQ